MHSSIVSLVAALAALAAAAPAVPKTHVLHEKRDVPARNWVKRDLLNRDIKLPMRIGMVQRNLDIGDELLMEVYVPLYRVVVPRTVH